MTIASPNLPLQPLRVASVQMESVPVDKAANFSRIRTLAARAAADGAQVIVFPELCTTGYWHLLQLSEVELSALAEPVPGGPSTNELLALAREHQATVGAGIIELDSERRMFNTYVVAMPN